MKKTSGGSIVADAAAATSTLTLPARHAARIATSPFAKLGPSSRGLVSPVSGASEGRSSVSRGMQCLEVWGGNGLTDSQLETYGLDLWAFSRPYGDSPHGGDVVYVSSCSSGRITRVLLADVAGHGEAAAEAATRLRDLMRRAINILSPGKLVRVLNREFEALSESGRFASALILSYYRPTGTLTVCNAGHPPPLLYLERERRWQIFAGGEKASERGSSRLVNLPLGIFSKVHYECFRLELEPGDRLLLYTDGLSELPVPGGGLLGTEGLLEIARREVRDRKEDAVSRLVRAAIREAGVDDFQDDASLLLLSPNERAAGLASDAMAPLRYLRHGLSRAGGFA